MIRFAQKYQHRTHKIFKYLFYLVVSLNFLLGFIFLIVIFRLQGVYPNTLLIGNIFGIFINTIINITSVLLIMKLNKGHNITMQNELKYRTLFDFSSDIIYLFELNNDYMPGNILEVNDAACQKFGYTKEELLLMNPLQFTANDRLSEVRKVQYELMEKGTLSFEGKYQTKNGQYIRSDITANVFKLGNKRVVLAISRDITERKILEEKLHHLAYHDSLTGLPNRDLLKNHFHEMKQGSKIGFLFVDLDGFKSINDSFGHDTGDSVIRLSAEKLTKCVGSRGLVSRFGGDEFLILLQNNSIEIIKDIAGAMIKSFSIPFKIDQKIAWVTVSIGISFSTIGDEKMDVIIKQADMAMYQAKENGKNNFHIFE